MENNHTKKYITLLLLFLSCESYSQNQDKFCLTLSFQRNIRSKDSNSDLYLIYVKESNVKYKYFHSGYPDTSSESIEYNVTEKSFKNLLKFIDTSSLIRNIDEINPDGNLGFSINIKLELYHKNTTSKIEIRGMINDWETKEESNIKNQDVIVQIERIIEALKEKREYF